jgi:hypothetical protein
MEDVLLDDQEPEHGARVARKGVGSAKRDDGSDAGLEEEEEDDDDTSKRKRPGAWRAMLQIRSGVFRWGVFVFVCSPVIGAD